MADTLSDILIRHQIYLQRLVPQLGAEQIKLIDKNNPALRGELISFLEENEFYNLTKKQQDKLAVLRNKVYKLRGGAINEAGEKYQADMLDLAQNEQLWIANGVQDLGGKSLALSSTSALTKMIERTPFVGKTLNNFYQKLSVDDTGRIMDTVRDGLNQGLTSNEIQTAVFGSKKLNYKDGILQNTRNYINNTNTNSGVTRTTVNGVQNEAKRSLYEANSDIVDKVQYVATLDFRTSSVCAGYDGDVFTLGKEPPLPQHINCRSTYVPIIEGIDIESSRPYVQDSRTRKQREKDFQQDKRDTGDSLKQQRAKFKKDRIGLVSDKTSFQGWMKTQPVKYQNEYFGKTKADLFRKGDLDIKRMTDPLGKPYTIEELYKLNGNAFKRAGLTAPK
jgi:SPP1 gp7 family putative phage head morphogenesis protein